MKKLIFAPMVAAAMLFSTSSFAQFNAGGGLFINKYGGDYTKFRPGLQLRLGYDVKEGKVGIDAGMNFSPVKGKYDIDIDYTNGSTGLPTPVAGNQSLGIQNIFVHGHYRFGAPENNLHFKFIAGASFDMLSLSYNTTGTVPSGYTKDGYENESATGPKIDLGLGIDYHKGPGDFYVDLMLGIPANTVNGEAFENPTSAHYGLAVGYKFYFGNRDNGY